MPNPLAESFRYNRWANLVLLAFCRALPAGALDQPAAVAWGTVRRAVLHLVGGEETQILRTDGRQHEGELSPNGPWPGWDVVIEHCTAAGDALVALAEAMDHDADVVLPYQGERPVFPKSFFLAHALGHSAEHRTQIHVALAAQGRDPPDLDGWAYAAAMGYGQTGST